MLERETFCLYVNVLSERAHLIVDLCVGEITYSGVQESPEKIHWSL